MKMIRNTVLLFSFCIIVLNGCSSGSDVIEKKTITIPGAKVMILMK